MADKITEEKDTNGTKDAKVTKSAKVSKDTKSTKNTKPKKQVEGPTYYGALGRRREATAQVRLYPDSKQGFEFKDKKYKVGDFIINGRQVTDYFPGEVYKKRYDEPFRTTNTLDRFFISVLVRGGGLSGQLGAVVHGVSRALEKIDKDKYRPILKKKGFMMRDPRKKQRRKAGFAQKSRARKQSPKR